MTLAPDTRKLLRAGGLLVLVGGVCALLMLMVFGGVTRQGPHTNLGWMALVVVMGTLPLGCLTLLLGFAKMFGSRGD